MNLPEAEEVLNLAVASRASNVLDLNGANLRGRHDAGCDVVVGDA